MATVTSRDVQEIVSKLSSEKARTREEGIKLLNTWLEGERSVGFCKWLSCNTAKLKPDEIPYDETWPFLITLLMDCVLSEISSSKRRLPKLMYAKTLRIAVQKAEDSKGFSNNLPLLTVVKSLFGHIWDVLREVQSFQSDYGIMLRHLLTVTDYRFHMRKKVYSGILLLYMQKVEANLTEKSFSGANSKEEIFRSILTLQSLLENPPGDFPETLRGDVVRGFITICASLRDEGKISRKLIECLNAYLLEDGPNLSHQALEIHDSVKGFVFHCWLTTHDRSLKATLIMYARLQLNLIRGSSDGNAIVEQLLDVVGRELDQSLTSSVSVSWSDANKEEKFGTLTSSQHDLAQLAALVFYRGCMCMNKTQCAEKRAKRQDVAVHLRDRLMSGKWMWHAAFCYLLQNYHAHLGKNLFTYWFDGICASLERILNDANAEHSYENLYWTLRSLRGLFRLLVAQLDAEKSLLKLSSASNKITYGWQTVWSCLMHHLPMFNHISSVADASFMLLGDLVSNDMVNMVIVPTDIWDLRCFKSVTSMSVLYFVSCYFSRKGSQGDLRDNLILRKNILRGILDLFTLKELFILDEHVVMLIPAAVYALSSGIFMIPCHYEGSVVSNAHVDPCGSSEDLTKVNAQNREGLDHHFEYYVNALAEINICSRDKVPVHPSQNYRGVRLPKQLEDPLLHEMESCIINTLLEEKPKKNSLSDIFLHCALISNLIYGSFISRPKDEFSFFHSKLFQYLLDLMESAISIIQDISMEAQKQGFLHGSCILEGTCPVTVSFKRFMHCSLFIRNSQESFADSVLYKSIIKCIERLLRGLFNLYVEYSQRVKSFKYELDSKEASFSGSPVKDASSVQSSISRIIDMELDVNNESIDPTINDQSATGVSSSNLKWKMDIASLISSSFPVLPVVTWDILFDILIKEANHKLCQDKVSQFILLSLCQNPHWSSSVKLSDLVIMINEMIELKMSVKLQCVDVLGAICCLLRSLLQPHNAETNGCEGLSLMGNDSEKSLEFLGDLVIRVADSNTLDWRGRVQMIDFIYNFICLNPLIGQIMIEKLLTLLHDTDYRVRLFLARKISILFQTWDGHEELFQDICSNFGIKLVVPSRNEVVKAADVLAAGAHPPPNVETIILTLMHLAYYSEKIEFEAVFMMCAISAIDPCQRELVRAALDNLSEHLQYACRSKYISELLGCILFGWVACGVSLPALVEIRDLFVLDVEPKHFLQFCCQWLLPSLILYEDTSNLDWLAQVIGQPVPVLVKNHFVPIFSVCMVLHCSKESGSEKGALVLQSSVLSLAEISVDERDKLIKKHMVSIISYILGIASGASNPPLPLFPREIVELAVRIVVDGFMEIGDCPNFAGVVDKIRIFRPDRVFMFIVEMHYKITAAVSPRHRCHRLSGIEVLVNILGHRATVASTSFYLFNLAGHFISCQSLQDQCCNVISTLLKTFNSNPSKETTHILGEQLQFLVSKLVACCVPPESIEGKACTPSSKVMSLLHLLTVDSDPSLHNYIREFEPFPEMDIFDKIRAFHLELCRAYSPWDHFLKFVKRSCHLPPRLLLLSLQALHKKLLGEVFHVKDNLGGRSVSSYGHHDNDIVQAVWSLVRMCSSEDADSVRALVADFVSRVGIGDPYSVVFRLSGSSSHIHAFGPISPKNLAEINFSSYSGMPEELLIALLRILKKYLMDDSVTVVGLTSQTLRGVLSTERGQRALLSFDSYERSLIEIHSKGVNIQLVEKCLLELEKKCAVERRSLEDSALWSTNEKTFETWICHLVYSLIPYCGDVILRLFQDIVLSKAEIAELLLPTVMVDLAGRKDLDVDLCKIISLQVEQYIFTESNTMTKSIQAMLGALNELRLCQVMERCNSDAMPSKRDGSKFSRSSSGYSSKSRSSAKAKDSAATVSATSTLAWDKVYWLSIDYLIVAKAAVSCGSYFTSVMYVEHWCEKHFKNMTLGNPDFSHLERVPPHVGILLSAITRISEPDSLYGIIQSNKLHSQIITFEHEGNWSKALEYYDLQVRSAGIRDDTQHSSMKHPGSGACTSFFKPQEELKLWKPHKGLIRCLQQTGCSHILDSYCQGLVSRNVEFQHDLEFVELQYEAAWRTGNWDYSLLYMGANGPSQYDKSDHFNESLHSCLRALQEGDACDFETPLNDLKQGLVMSVHNTSEESTGIIYSTIVKLQILDHLTIAWDLRWKSRRNKKSFQEKESKFSEAMIPTTDQLSMLNAEWDRILKETQLNMNLLEPFVAFRRVKLQILGCTECTLQHLLQSSSILRKGSRFSQAAAALHEFKFMCNDLEGPLSAYHWLGRLEEAKLLRAQDQHQMAINLGIYIAENNQLSEGSSDVYRLVGKWLAETRSSNSRTILEKYLKRAVLIADSLKNVGKNSLARQCQTHFHLAHYADALFRSHEERLNSSEWQAAMRLRKHKTLELEALIKRLRSSTKGDKTDYSMKIQELQKQLTMDKEEAEKLQNDRDNFLNLTLDGYKRCLVVGDKYDVRVVFRLISLWFGLSSRQHVVTAMLTTIKEVHSFKFIPLVYQIASRMGNSKDIQGPNSFQFALVSLVKKMAIDHPYHTIFQLLALANGDRIKDKQRSRNSFVVDMDKKLAAEKLLEELSKYHGAIIKQMKQMVEVYIKLAELETKREDTNKRMSLPREIRNLRQLELVPVVTANVPVDRSCQYQEGSFPHFQGLADSVIVMNGINAPKVVECYGSDGRTYKQLAKSGNDDLRQDAVMEQFFGLVNTFLQNHRDTWKRKLGIRTYKVVPFTPSAGVIEWVDGTLPLGEYLLGSTRNGGAHGRYGVGDWSFPKCREHMANAKDKRKAYQEVCDNFRPVMHHFFLERFLQPADWFEKRLAYTRSVAASSMVGYIVGLGDRHSMNILIDQATAEVVHIDLGVAFEQGLMLKTPERVPFRLTRDIIDGMGVTGVEGVFRRCSEQTLAVMRTNKEALLTIIEVFIHDPLYKWALSPLKALQRQKETDDCFESSWDDSQGEYEGNKDAARALLRVKQKLDGYEEGEMRSLHGQVQQLIQDATDSERLCQMFPGWAAWL